jgi:hypothetical protein
MKVTATAAIVLLITVAAGCKSHDNPPTPLTASLDLQPVPKHENFGWFGLPEAGGMVTGKTPIRDVKMMEDAASADNRRKGIVALSRREYGQREPYTRRYRQIAQSDSDALVRATAVRALNASRDKSAVPVFIAALSDKSDLVRLQAAKALSTIPDATAAEPLSRTLGNQAEQRDVRIAAAEALRHYRNAGVTRVLAGTVQGRDFSLAWQSRWSLKLITGRDFGHDERKWLEYLASQAKAVG